MTNDDLKQFYPVNGNQDRPNEFARYDEERNYLTAIFTPITNETELEVKFKVVYGDAEKLNEELQKE